MKEGYLKPYPASKAEFDSIIAHFFTNSRLCF